MSAPRAYYVGHVNDAGELVLLRRDDAGVVRAHRQRAEYSFFAKRSEVNADRELVRELRRANNPLVLGVKVEGNDWLRVRCADAEARRAASRYFEYRGVAHYEADVHPVRRFFSDNPHAIQRPRLVSLDIETDSRKTFAEARAGKARVLCWTIKGEDGLRRRGVLRGTAESTDEELDLAEAELLHELWDALAPYDCVLSWNGEEFDFLVVQKRSKLLGVRTEDPSRYPWLFHAWLDHLEVYARMIANASESGAEKRSMKLEDVAQEHCGHGKYETPPEVVARFGNRPLGALTWELWAAGGEWRELMVRYCEEDTALLFDIEKETGFVSLLLAVCDVCKVFPETLSTNPLIQVDAFLLRLGAENDHHFATKFRLRDEERPEKFLGAYVMDPKIRGIGKDVHVVDFAGMYPSIMMTWNMSPETKREVPTEGEIPDGHCRSRIGAGFLVEPRGLLVGALEKIGEQREYYTQLAKKHPKGSPEHDDAARKSAAMKVIRNSYYGVVSSPMSRYHDRQIGESTTQNGVWLLRDGVIASAEARGWVAVYGDTDSAFITGPTDDEMRDFVAWCNSELFPRMTREQGCVANYIELAYEKKFERIVMPTKKRYCGLFAHYKGTPPKPSALPEIRGLEWRRGDVSVLAARLQLWVIGMLMWFRVEEPEPFVEVVEAMRDHVLAGDLLLDDIKQSKSLSKEIPSDSPSWRPRANVEYYSLRRKNDGGLYPLPPHVEIAKAMRARGEECRVGTRIDYYVRDGKASPQVVAPAEEYKNDPDRHFLWEKQVWPPTQRLLEAAFPDRDWSAYDKTRPKTPRANSGSRAKSEPVPRKKKAVPEPAQLPMPSAPAPSRAVRPLVVQLDPARANYGTVGSVLAVLACYAGRRPVRVLMGAEECEAPLKVRDCPELRTALVRFDGVTVGAV